MMTGTSWDIPTSAFVWDHRSRAMMAGAELIDSLTEADRAAALAALSSRIRDLVTGLDDSWLAATAVFMPDDLFRSCFNEFRWSPGVADYLAATAPVVLQDLQRRGLVLHYVVDNVDTADYLTLKLAEVLMVFDAAGFAVTGPQLMAQEFVCDAGADPTDIAAIQAWRDAGHAASDQIIADCHAQRRSSLYLNLDVDDDLPALSVQVALSAANSPGTIVVFRDQAPRIGTITNIALPPGLVLPAASRNR